MSSTRKVHAMLGMDINVSKENLLKRTPTPDMHASHSQPALSQLVDNATQAESEQSQMHRAQSMPNLGRSDSDFNAHNGTFSDDLLNSPHLENMLGMNIQVSKAELTAAMGIRK